MLQLESLVYDFARQLVEGYEGAYWDFYELSNGGFLMVPQIPPAEVSVEGNGFCGTMKPDSIGITVCLFAYSHASFALQSDLFARYYYRLREFALEQPESRLIVEAID